MIKFKFRIPRFQFFYSTFELFFYALKLITTSNNKHNKAHQFNLKMLQLFGRKNAQIVSSYRMGLYFTLKSLNLEKNDEVLLTPITIADTINAIYLAGLTPVFLEMDPETHCVDTAEIKKKISSKTKVLLVTYLSGIVPDIGLIQRITKDNKLFFIEDISQSMDADYKMKKVGSHGDVSIASLSCGKNISSLYGGLILTDLPNIADRITQLAGELKIAAKKTILFYYLSNCIKVQVATSRLVFPVFVFPILQLLSFLTKKYPFDPHYDPCIPLNIFQSSKPILRKEFPTIFFTPIINWQIDIMEHQLTRLRAGTLKRRYLAKILISHLSCKSLQNLPKGLLNVEENSYYHFPIKTNGNKTALRKHLFQNGIDNGSYGLNLCSEENVFPVVTHLPKSHAIKNNTLFLPIHESYTKEQMVYIAKTVNIFFDQN